MVRPNSWECHLSDIAQLIRELLASMELIP